MSTLTESHFHSSGLEGVKNLLTKTKRSLFSVVSFRLGFRNPSLLLRQHLVAMVSPTPEPPPVTSPALTATTSAPFPPPFLPQLPNPAPHLLDLCTFSINPRLNLGPFPSRFPALQPARPSPSPSGVPSSSGILPLPTPLFLLPLPLWVYQIRIRLHQI